MNKFLNPSEFQSHVPPSHYFNSYDTVENILSKEQEHAILTARAHGLIRMITSKSYQIHPLYAYTLRNKANNKGSLPKIKSQYLDFYQQYIKQLTIKFEENHLVSRKFLDYEISNLVELLFKLVPNQRSIEPFIYLIHYYYQGQENRTERKALLEQLIAQFEKSAIGQINRQLLLDYISCQDNLALIYREEGDYNLSISIYQQSLKAWEAQNKPETILPLFSVTKSSLLIHLATSFRADKQFKKSQDHIEQAINLAEEYGTPSLKAATYIELGHLHKDRLNYKKSKIYYEKALALANEDAPLKAMILFNLGALADDLKQWKKSLQYYDKALIFFEQTNKIRLQATIYQNKGLVFEESGQPEKAIESFKKAIPLFIKLGDTFLEAQLYQNISIPYLNLYHFDESLDYLQKALRIYLEVGNPHLEAEVYHNMGEVFRRKGEYQSSITINKKALQLYTQLNNQVSIGVIHQNLGNTFIGLKNYNKAENQYTLALSIFKQLNNRHGIGSVWHNLSNLGYHRNDFNYSRKYALNALKIYTEFRNFPKLGWLIALANKITYELGKDKVFLSEMNDYLEAHFSSEEMEKIIGFARKYYDLFS